MRRKVEGSGYPRTPARGGPATGAVAFASPDMNARTAGWLRPLSLPYLLRPAVNCEGRSKAAHHDEATTLSVSLCSEI